MLDDAGAAVAARRQGDISILFYLRYFCRPTTEVHRILGVPVRATALAAWREIARRGEGLKMAHFQITFEGVTLTICSRLRRDGLIEIEVGIGDPTLY